jgi:hypothetical protein
MTITTLKSGELGDALRKYYDRVLREKINLVGDARKEGVVRDADEPLIAAALQEIAGRCLNLKGATVIERLENGAIFDELLHRIKIWQERPPNSLVFLHEAFDPIYEEAGAL